MDHARKIGKSTNSKEWIPQPGRWAACCDSYISEELPIVEDERFVNWRKWLSDRKDVYGHLKSSTGRDQTEQVMNSCETIRPLVEMRNLMEYATVPAPVIPDQFRGGPEFWRTPLALPNKDPCLPEITVAMTKKELNVMPDLTYVGTPELVQEEKDLARLREKQHFWKQSQYLKKRREELTEEIKVLQMQEPEMERLVIEGHAYKEKPKMLRVPPISISLTEDDSSCQDPDLAIVLKVQDREIVWDRRLFDAENMDPDPQPITWNLTLAGVVDGRSEQVIRFENKGTRTIVYQWRPANYKSASFDLEARFSPFYFNKNKELILPGQIVELKIWYLPRNPGIFTESWRLLTDVKLSPSPLIFRFWGCAVECNDPSVRKEFDPAKIEILLDHRVRDTAIRAILEDIINSLDCCQEPRPTYGSLFLESEIFRTKNPFHHYHPTLTIEFRKLYHSVVDERAPSWNLSIMDLRGIVLEMDDAEHRSESLKQLNDLAKQSLKPTLHQPLETRKHEMVYAALCSLVNQIEVESEVVLSMAVRRETARESWESSELDTMKSASTSVLSIGSRKSSTSKGRRARRGSRKRSISQDPGHGVDRDKDKDQAYCEILFVRVYHALAETVDRACAIIDSFNRLNVPDK